MRDEWSGLADLLASLIEKYAEPLEIENLPDPTRPDCYENKRSVKTAVANTDAA